MGVPTITSTALIRHTTTATVKRKLFQSSDIRFFSPLCRVGRRGGISNSSRSGQRVICMKWSGKYGQNSFNLSESENEKKTSYLSESGGGKGSECNILSISSLNRSGYLTNGGFCASASPTLLGSPTNFFPSL